MIKVLIINRDPDPLVCRALKCHLGANIKCAPTGRLGAEALAYELFDLAVIGVPLEDMSGFELAERAAHTHTPVLLLSGDTDALSILGKHDYPYLAKPFHPFDVVDEVALIITHSSENIQRVKTAMAKRQAAAEERQTASSLTC